MRRSLLALVSSLCAVACTAAPSLEGNRSVGESPGSNDPAVVAAHPEAGKPASPPPSDATTNPGNSNSPGSTGDIDDNTPGIAGKLAPPSHSACTNHPEGPITTEIDAQNAGGVGLADGSQKQLAGERKGGLDKTFLLDPFDVARRGIALQPIRNFAGGGPLHAASGGSVDSDGDCLSDDAEAAAGTDPLNPDSDGDGWLDGACNERRKLVLASIKVHESQDLSFFGGDDFYVIADDIRYPNSTSDLDGQWRGWKTDSTHAPNRVIATRTRGAKAAALANVRVEGFDDDWEIFNSWTVDDLLTADDIDLGKFKNGESFTRRHKSSDWDYEITYRVDIEHFADPEPTVDGDSDKDGIKESAEAAVAVDFGGVVDPTRADVLVEIDWMTGHGLRTEAKRQVATRLASRGINLFAWRDEEIVVDDCLRVKEAQAIYKAHFGTLKYNAFRYAIVGEKIWNDASGVAWGDVFLVDDSTWWISGGVQAQAGTFIHELGHTMGLTKDTFAWIDSISWLSYDSAMNYTFQALLVDYDDDANSDWNHNDWADVVPGHALRWSFAKVASEEIGVCK